MACARGFRDHNDERELTCATTTKEEDLHFSQAASPGAPEHVGARARHLPAVPQPAAGAPRVPCVRHLQGPRRPGRERDPSATAPRLASFSASAWRCYTSADHASRIAPIARPVECDVSSGRRHYVFRVVGCHTLYVLQNAPRRIRTMPQSGLSPRPPDPRARRRSGLTARA